MNANLPMLSELSNAGCKRLQKDAATITPAANPVNIRLSLSDISFLRKNTIAAPSDVPINGIKIPITIFAVI